MVNCCIVGLDELFLQRCPCFDIAIKESRWTATSFRAKRKLLRSLYMTPAHHMLAGLAGVLEMRLVGNGIIVSLPKMDACSKPEIPPSLARYFFKMATSCSA